MGFFSSLGRALTNVKRAACRGVGKVIEKVGEITGNIDIEMKGYEIQCNNPYLEKQVDLNSSSTSVQDTIDVHKMCEETRQQAASQARKYEDEFVDKIEEDINGFIVLEMRLKMIFTIRYQIMLQGIFHKILRNL